MTSDPTKGELKLAELLCFYIKSFDLTQICQRFEISYNLSTCLNRRQPHSLKTTNICLIHSCHKCITTENNFDKFVFSLFCELRKVYWKPVKSSHIWLINLGGCFAFTGQFAIVLYMNTDCKEKIQPIFWAIFNAFPVVF